MFADRAAAGRALAQQLGALADDEVVVLALPRGGVPVAAEIARALGAPMDVIGVRKLGAPGHREFAIGAIAEGDVRFVDEDTVRALRLDASTVDTIAAEAHEQLEQRMRTYRGDRDFPEVRGRTVVVVDDGLATGSTALAACRAVRAKDPGRLILAVPVASREGIGALRNEGVEVVHVEAPPDFVAVGRWYRDFGQTTDDEVVDLLADIGTPSDDGPADVEPSEVRIPVDGDVIVGDLTVPAGARGLVTFAHGSGSSRHSSRNQQVARALSDEGFATLLMDLLTERDEAIDARTRELRFDIGLLARRVAAAVDWSTAEERTRSLPIGLFGASTGAAAALVAAAERPETVASVVSRGGRPDLAGDALSAVEAPTLLIVGGADHAVIGMNSDAMDRMSADVELTIVPGATHLFEEPGALEQVARLAADHFDRTLS